MKAHHSEGTTATRQQRLELALFRGRELTLDNPYYLSTVRSFTKTLLLDDLRNGDWTSKALVIEHKPTSARIIAREQGVAAGIAEFTFLVNDFPIDLHSEKADGETIEAGDVLIVLRGDPAQLLAVERVGLNLLQRMCGIATATRRLQERVHLTSPATSVVATRKTPWGLLDKRAVHVGGGGTHRLTLGDAILVKNNHLALLADREEDAVCLAIERAWQFRKKVAFIEIEVRNKNSSLAAAATFRRLRETTSEQFPCLLLFDNMTPESIQGIMEALQRERLWDHTLVEASGGISESNIAAYAACALDAVSLGALTHSPHALDIRQEISQEKIGPL